MLKKLHKLLHQNQPKTNRSQSIEVTLTRNPPSIQSSSKYHPFSLQTTKSPSQKKSNKYKYSK